MRGWGLVVAGCALVLACLAPLKASADGPNRAGVVVSFGDGRSESVCVEFTEPEISGAELLSRAGFSVVESASWGGGATCMIDGVGCPNPSDCWCQCQGGSCRYWAYYTLADGGWRYSAVGSSLRKVHDGDVDGWAWGAGGIGTGTEPAASSFDAICPPLVPTPSSTATSVSSVEGVAIGPNATVAPPAQATILIAPATIISTAAASPSPSPTPTVAPASSGGFGSRPTWQIALFAAVFSALAMTSLVFFRGRFHG
ncbi:MAG: hypothetical protein ABSG55_05215 [Dehalococcoidia bacterium]